MKKEFLVNERIWAREVRVIDQDGQQKGIMKTLEAVRTAREAGLDLVLVAPEAKPPVCRIVDYGKFRYEQVKKEKESRKSLHAGILKELKLKPKIGEHDFLVRVRKAKELLENGYKVKVLVFFRGREASHPEFGIKLLERMSDELKEAAIIESKMQLGNIRALTFVPKHA